MPINKLGALPFEDDEELEDGFTSSRVVFKWTNGYSYDLQPLMEADESELDDAGIRVITATPNSRLSVLPGLSSSNKKPTRNGFP